METTDFADLTDGQGIERRTSSLRKALRSPVEEYDKSFLIRVIREIRG